MLDQRPTADALLERIKQQDRARLRVYVGAARLPQEEVPLTKLLGKPEHPMAGQTSGSPAKPLTGRQ